MKSINPVNNKVIREFKEFSLEKVESIIDEVYEQQKKWIDISFEERAAFLKRISFNLEKRKDELAKLMAEEMGKPIKEGRSEIEKCAWVCDYYAEHAEDFLKNDVVKTDASISYVAFKPLGVIFAIMPWNFPFWQVFRCLAPNFMAGNGVVLKHAENVPGCCLAIEDVVNESNPPSHIFKSLLLDKKNAKSVIQNKKIAAVTLTGSTKAGKAVAADAGEVLKRCVFELGGSDPYIIFEDADIEEAAKTCATSRLINNGQSCIAAKRFIVMEKVYDQFLESFIKEIKGKKVGNPFLEDVDLGPMARKDLKDGLQKQVDRSVEAGAKIEYQSELDMEHPKDSAYFPITVLTDVKKGMAAYSEELFGPVASFIKVKTEDEAIEVANSSSFGLGSAIFSRDVKKAEDIAANKLEAGSCFVNEFVKSDPRLPFGGIKESGYGRELGLYGIREFVNIKTVYIK